MQRENYLKLVKPKAGLVNKLFWGLNKLGCLNFKIPFIKTKADKLAALQVFLLQKYRIEDLRNPVSINIPYFLRAEQKINSIIKNNEIDSEYKKNCRRNLLRGFYNDKKIKSAKRFNMAGA